MALQIGGVPYGVGRPLVLGLDQEPGVAVHRARPTQLIEGLRAGTLDAALVSSIEGARRPGYRALPDLGIASRTVARSVRLFRHHDAKIIRTVGVDAGSATSVALTRILLDRVFSPRGEASPGDYTIEVIEPDRAVDNFPHDLVLLIGDEGLAADGTTREPLDAGSLWHEWTGLPFVFALWLLAPHADAEAVAAVLRRTHRRNAENRPDPDQRADSNDGAIHYELDATDHTGLRRFYGEAVALNLCTADRVPQFIDVLKGDS